MKQAIDFPRNGFTLIEVLISIFLSSFLSLLIFKILFYSEEQFRYQQACLETEQHLGLAQHYLTRHIQEAGVTACSHLGALIIQDHSGVFSPFLAVQGYDTDHLPSSLAKQVKPGTDAIRIQLTSYPPRYLSKNMPDESSPPELLSPLKITSSHPFLVNDCLHGDLFLVNKINSSQISHPMLSKAYNDRASLDEFLRYTYFVKSTQRKDDRGALIYALYQEDNRNTDREIVQGINNLVIRYEIDNHYQEANTVTDWSQVKNVEIEISANSSQYFQDKLLNLKQSFLVHVRN